MLKIALFDRNEYDDIERYSKYGKVTLHTRYNGAKATDADVIFTTFSRPPDIDGTIVNMASSDARHLSHIVKAKIVQAKQWNVHEVARWTLSWFPKPPATIVVIGRGQIGRLVTRYARFLGHTVWDYPHDVKSIPRADIISLHVRLSDETRGFYDMRHFVNQQRCLVVNSARPGLLDKFSVMTALRHNQIGSLCIDGGKEHYGYPDRVTNTGHTAWQGPRSRLLRPWRIEQILRQITDERRR